jgi:hypothetical protein
MLFKDIPPYDIFGYYNLFHSSYFKQFHPKLLHVIFNYYKVFHPRLFYIKLFKDILRSL